jgi:hypothetical protein
VILLRSRENMLWLVDRDDYTGYVIKNELP